VEAFGDGAVFAFEDVVVLKQLEAVRLLLNETDKAPQILEVRLVEQALDTKLDAALCEFVDVLQCTQTTARTHARIPRQREDAGHHATALATIAPPVVGITANGGGTSLRSLCWFGSRCGMQHGEAARCRGRWEIGILTDQSPGESVAGRDKQ
jgi:hypothetical protein